MPDSLLSLLGFFRGAGLLYAWLRLGHSDPATVLKGVNYNSYTDNCPRFRISQPGWSPKGVPTKITVM